MKRTLAQEERIESIKVIFEQELKTNLSLTKVNAPLFVPTNSGLNDNLNGIEKAVSFNLSGEEHQVVHSLAKWKRWYLGEIEVPKGKGILANMIAIRADETLSPIHSHLVDQWDWEKVIDKTERNTHTLIKHGERVFSALKFTQEQLTLNLGTNLPDDFTVIHSEDLLQQYPKLTPKEREHKIAEKHGAVFLIGIGGKLSNGEPHDFRAPDYDDWMTLDDNGKPGLNADLLVWDSSRKMSLEISSMGIRVDKIALEKQLKALDAEERLQLPFHQKLVKGELPYTIGGGIGQSRVSMFISKHSDIKDVQAIY